MSYRTAVRASAQSAAIGALAACSFFPRLAELEEAAARLDSAAAYIT